MKSLRPYSDTGQSERRSLSVRGFYSWALIVVLAVLLSLAFSGSAPGSIPLHRTIVSITFDDGRASQWTARAALRAHGMNATFYLNSPAVGNPGWLGWDQIATLASDGDEIGGHTLTHRDLTELTPADVQTEICSDRDALVAHGFDPDSFAYPFGATNADVEAAVADCGYTSARITDGILGSAGWCTPEKCPPAESIPPWDPYDIRGTGSVTDDETLAELESFVTTAEQNGGGWLPFIFHDVGYDEDGYSISEADFSAFLNWLSLRRSRGTVVLTVGEVMNGSASPPPAGPNVLANPSLEDDADADGTPDCWQGTSWGTNEGSWDETGDFHSGSVAMRGTITSWTSGQRQLAGSASSQCTPSVTPGHNYGLTAWYKGSLSPALTIVWDDGSGEWALGRADSPDFPVSSTWRKASWTTPPAPESASAARVILSIAGGAGDITVDDFSLGDTLGTPPSIQITAPANGGLVPGGTLDVSADAADDDAVQSVEFFVDDVSLGTIATSPYTLPWSPTGISDGTHTLTALATDVDGALSSDSISFTLDATPPTASIDSHPALRSPSSSTVFAFSSLDGGETFTCSIDGSDYASCSSPKTYAGLSDGEHSFSVKASDLAGNESDPASFSWSTDTVAPSASMNAPNGGSFARGSIVLSVDASDSGSGVASVSFQERSSTAAWTLVGLDTSAPYSTQLDTTTLVDGPHELRAIAEDGAGNKRVSTAVSITVDNTPPLVSIKAPARRFLRGTVRLNASATDADSGVASIGLERLGPGRAGWRSIAVEEGATYSALWRTRSVRDGTYRLRVVATDRAGNETASQPLSVAVDNTKPASSIACNRSVGCRRRFSARARVMIKARDRRSGVRMIRYTLNGRKPTLSSRLYRHPLKIRKTLTIRWRVWDKAGNVSRIRSRAIRLKRLPSWSRPTL